MINTLVEVDKMDIDVIRYLRVGTVCCIYSSRFARILIIQCTPLDIARIAF